MASTEVQIRTMQGWFSAEVRSRDILIPRSSVKSLFSDGPTVLSATSLWVTGAPWMLCPDLPPGWALRSSIGLPGFDLMRTTFISVGMIGGYYAPSEDMLLEPDSLRVRDLFTNEETLASSELVFDKALWGSSRVVESWRGRTRGEAQAFVERKLRLAGTYDPPAREPVLAELWKAEWEARRRVPGRVS